MNKIFYGIGILMILIAIVAGYAYMKLAASPTRVAVLNIEEGNAQVDSGKGWVNAVDEMDLSADDKVKTNQDSMASIVLYESIIISLEPSTEIAILDLAKQNIKLKQDSGETWNKFTALAGVGGLSIQTPTTVATVRGTAFGLGMKAVLVGEGKVDYTFEGETMTVEQDEKAELETATEDGTAKRKMVKKAITQQDRDKIAQKMQRTVKMLKKIREMEVKKNSFLAKQLQKRYNIDEAKIKEYLDRADIGEFDLNELEKKSPVKIEAVKKIKGITQEIIEQNKQTERIARQKLEAVQHQIEQTEQREQLQIGISTAAQEIRQQIEENKAEIIETRDQTPATAPIAPAKPADPIAVNAR
jgi:hypothetical protein